MNVSIVTPTGDRHHSLARQARYIARSVLPQGTKLTWIVVDDGKDPCRLMSLGVDVVCIPQAPMDGCSLVRNLLAGVVESIYHNPDYVLFWEDDDWYAKDWIASQLEPLVNGKEKRVYMSGPARSLYYNVPMRIWREMANNSFSSMYETAVSKEILFPLIEFLKESVRQSKGIDRKMWGRFANRSATFHPKERRSIGLKGMPGRRGIGCGHDPRGSGWAPDPDGKHLIALIGEEDAVEIFKEGGVL